jgi:hypothetical protein
MNIEIYFSEKKGTGVLGTSDSGGNVNLALYSRPHVIDDSTVAFIMRDRLSHHNLQSNKNAAYLFIEEQDGYHGIRLTLRMLKESSDQELIKSMRGRIIITAGGENENFYYRRTGFRGNFARKEPDGKRP